MSFHQVSTFCCTYSQQLAVTPTPRRPNKVLLILSPQLPQSLLACALYFASPFAPAPGEPRSSAVGTFPQIACTIFFLRPISTRCLGCSACVSRSVASVTSLSNDPVPFSHVLLVCRQHTLAVVNILHMTSTFHLPIYAQPSIPYLMRTRTKFALHNPPQASELL